ncbi:MAG: hypothetical protein JWO82_4222 [Akkermansiaceae bacterium]|nr:hypothetical protein [Akkermansiaceae bacterium]
MKEIWDLAISPAMLPLTILLVPVGIYWLLSVIGAAGHGVFHGHGGHGGHVGGHHHDIGGHHHGGAHGHQGHAPGHGGHGHGSHGNDDGHDSPISDFLHGALRILNAQEVPVMIVLSVLVIFLWGGAMIGNLWFHPNPDGWGGTLISLGSLATSIVATRLILIPVKPLFRMMQTDVEEETPITGRSGYVRTAFVTESDGQVVVENRGSPIIVGARTVHGAEPISRNTTVLIVGRDAESGLYVVRLSNETSH